MPERIQRSRRRGWKMPAGAIYVGRPTKFGNPFSDGTPAQNVANFERHLRRSPKLQELVKQLAGHDLACWCPLDQPCHADVLLQYINR
jgi:hypothetical protein